MARLQVLHLPSAPDGAARFALVADQAAELPEADREALRAFATEAGAQGCLVLSGAVELAYGEDEQRDEELAQQLADLVRTTSIQPAGQQKPKLPPPNTTEGKLARSWGGTNPTEGADPR